MTPTLSVKLMYYFGRKLHKSKNNNEHNLKTYENKIQAEEQMNKIVYSTRDYTCSQLVLLLRGKFLQYSDVQISKRVK